MTDPTERVPLGVRLKVDRAVHHIKDLEAAVKRFMESNPYGVVRETDEQTGGQIFRLQIRKDIPMAWSALIGDAIHNLRSALDHLMVELVLANGGTVTNATEFPIFENVHAYNAKAAGKVIGASQQAIDLIDAAQPYKGGNDGLWQIHKLDIIDKHRSLVTGYGSYTAFTFDPAKSMRDLVPDWPEMSLPISIRPAERCPLEDGQALLGLAADVVGHFDDEPTFKIEIAFNEPGVLECEPIFPLLGDLSELVKRVILAIAVQVL